MIYISPVNNHAFTITRVHLEGDMFGTAYELLVREQNFLSKAGITYEFDKAMEWIGVKVAEGQTCYTVVLESEK